MTDTDLAAMADKDAQALLQQAVGHLQNNREMEAEATLGGLLKSRPNDPDALQLLGVLRRAQNRLDEAEQLYRQSLEANPNQPQVHHNLGNLLRAMGRLEEAAAAQREAVRLKPNYLEAHINLATVLAEQEKFADAEKSIRRALQIQPNLAFAKQTLGGILTDQGKFKEAETVLRQALAAGSPNPRQIAALEHNLGVSVSLQGRFDEALQLFDSAQAKVPEMPHVDYNRANALQGAGQLDAAVEFYRRAVARNPLDMNAHRDLNTLLYRMGRDEEVLRSYDEAFSFYPTAGGLPLAKANFLFNRGDYGKASEEYQRASRVFPDHAKPHDGLGISHARQGDYDAAIREHEMAVAKDARNGEYWRNFGDTLSRAGDGKKALSVLQRALEIDPFDQAALAFSSVALRQVKDTRDDVLNDYERFVQVLELEPPEGYSDVESFNRDLNSFLDSLHDSKREFVDQSIRGGTQTMFDLFGRGHDLVERLRRRIDEAVAAYIANLPESSDHPFLSRRSPKFGYSGSWSSRLRDCGYHDNHYHQKGWISSAYYIALPDAVNDAQKKEGWIKFGEPSFDAGIADPIRRSVKPQSGRLVLFPSYMWHGTVPFHSSQTRTTLAFDAVPK
ncbi:MAG TPA: tetratricopeptide repeat protein [Rhizomicrobium sp.]